MLSAIVDGRAGVSPEMAVRLSLPFHCTTESWLALQLEYEVYEAEKKRDRFQAGRSTSSPSR